ncbi:glucose dehydrogenase [Bradyrhizobium sp. ERR14]|nr:glucose dehydrogenase [Bradyrhizobium sp. ERR14]
MPSQPSLVDLRSNSGTTPAIYIPAKTGDIFVLDLATDINWCPRRRSRCRRAPRPATGCLLPNPSRG